MRVAVIRDRTRREVHEPRLPPESGDVGHAVRRRNALHSRPFKVEVVKRRRVVHLHGVGPRRQSPAVEVVPLRVTQGDLAAPFVLDDADQRPPRGSQTSGGGGGVVGIRRYTAPLPSPRAPERKRPRRRCRASRRSPPSSCRPVHGDLELDVPERRRAVVAVDVATDDRRQRRVANHVPAGDRAACAGLPSAGTPGRVGENRRRRSDAERLALVEVVSPLAAAPAVVRSRPYPVARGLKLISSQTFCPTSAIERSPVWRSKENRHGLRRP